MEHMLHPPNVPSVPVRVRCCQGTVLKNVTDRGEEGLDMWIHRGPLEEPWLQIGNLSFFFVAFVNALKWVIDKLTNRMVGRQGRRDVKTALPKAASYFAWT